MLNKMKIFSIIEVNLGKEILLCLIILVLKVTEEFL
jgi:hypothetical protein